MPWRRRDRPRPSRGLPPPPGMAGLNTPALPPPRSGRAGRLGPPAPAGFPRLPPAPTPPGRRPAARGGRPVGLPGAPGQPPGRRAAGQGLTAAGTAGAGPRSGEAARPPRGEPCPGSEREVGGRPAAFPLLLLLLHNGAEAGGGGGRRTPPREPLSRGPASCLRRGAGGPRAAPGPAGSLASPPVPAPPRSPPAHQVVHLPAGLLRP